MGNAWDDLNGGWAGADKPKKGAMNPHETNADWAKFSVHTPGCDPEERLIFGNWIQHLRTMGEYRRMSREQWRAKRDQLGDLVRRCKPVIIRSIQDEPCYGFICAEYQGEAQVLHFLYIRNMWRRRGFANVLMRVSFNRLGRAPIYYTHPMRATRYFKDRWQLVYRPKRIFWREDDHPFNAASPRGNPRIIGA